MVILTFAALSGVANFLGQITSLINALPASVKYFIFLGLLTIDTTVLNGLIGQFFTGDLNIGFGIPVIITSWELLIIFLILPVFFYALRH